VDGAEALREDLRAALPVLRDAAIANEIAELRWKISREVVGRCALEKRGRAELD